MISRDYGGTSFFYLIADSFNNGERLFVTSRFKWEVVYELELS